MRRPATQRRQKAEGRRWKAEVPLAPQAAALAAQSQFANRQSHILWWLLVLGLVLGTMALYWPATRCDFVNYDDDWNLTENPHVLRGLTWGGVKVCLFEPMAGPGWTPLTMFSHMLAIEVFGLNPWGHHLINIVVHALNAALVFALLHQMTGAKWRSLWVAVFFAFHPLRVEAVAWVTQRRELLMIFFGLLSLIAYVRYVKGRREKAESRKQKAETRSGQPEAQGPGSLSHLPSSVFYLLSLGFLGLGLMSKPTLVTWPFVLLLLDYWPLGRMQRSEVRGQSSEDSGTQHAPRSTLLPLVREKIPFFGIVGCMSLGTFLVLKLHDAKELGSRLPLGARAGNALVAYCGYLGKQLWPVDLAVLYPHPGHCPFWQVLLAVVLLLGISALVLVRAQRHPYLVVGWLWFCGTLVPMSQVVAIGTQATADRWSYISSPGLLILLIWGAFGGKEEGRRMKDEGRRLEIPAAPQFHPSSFILHPFLLVAMVLCLAMTRQQLGYWLDSEALFRHAVAVTKDNYGAYNNLGSALGKKGQIEEAIRQFQEALRIKPDYTQALINLGAVLGQKGEMEQAIQHLREAVRLDPNFRDGHYLLGLALVQNGQLDEAIRQFQEAIHANPDHVGAHYDLGLVLGRKGEMDQAIQHLREAVRLNPDHAGAHINLGVALSQKGEMDEAIRHYQEALRLKPEDASVHYNLGAALAKRGQLDEAIRHYQEALRLEPNRAEAHNNLGTLFYQQGRTGEAIREFQEALRLKPDYTEARKNLMVALAAQASPAPLPGAATNR